jgi:hypothetical protein
MYQTLLQWLNSGEPKEMYKLAALGILLAEDLIARSPLKANSTIQLVIGILTKIPIIGKALAAVGVKK